MITTDHLYYVFPTGAVGLSDINLNLPTGSRTLLIGSNGAGKSTLLRVLSGKTMAKAGAISVDGVDPFRDGTNDTSYLGTEWAANQTVRRDVGVALLISSIGGDTFPERRDELIDILDIDLNWRMNAVSDGERRRVQLCMGLLRPWKMLFLDEVTVDLDVLVRARLLDFLENETKSRDCQIVYATHIFDGLNSWPTHIVHLHLGTVTEQGTAADILALAPKGGERGSPLLELALLWLQQDLTARGKREAKTQWDDIKDKVTGGLEAPDKFSAYFKMTRGIQ